MFCLGVHQFSPLSLILNTTKLARASTLSSACYPIQCTMVNSTNITNNTTIFDNHIHRRSANYEPPIWSFDYIQSLSSSQYKGETCTSRLNELEANVKEILLVEMKSNSLAQLEFIDALQRLGLSYRFETEINTILNEKYSGNIIDNPNYNLYATALEFRLLRHHGYDVSQEIFNVFKDEITSKFKARTSGEDIIGVLALYEASFYGKKSESILEEARVSSIECLENYVATMTMERNKPSLLVNDYDDDNNMLLLVNHALELPLYWRITRSEARWFIDLYEKNHNMNSTLLEFAKLDYNMVQSIYQEDLKHLSRWDVKAMDDLPEYMRMPFFLLHNTINEMAFDVLGHQNFLNVKFLKRTWVDFCKHQLQEAKWFHSGYKPTFEEYINNAWISVSGPIILMDAYFSLTNPVTKDAINLLELGYPPIIYHASMILRLTDDLGTSNDEMKRGDIPKSIQCYMNDTGVSEDEARDHMKFLISELWKEINNEDENMDSPFSKQFLQNCKNLARISQFIYQYGDGHASQDSLSKQRISELIINHIPS
ncbi:hypothetical protein F8388_024571 [Cannabis sativa]|nr:hypothetical protein F8388_024571 [Cannabis sativa]KAF4398961.1 hypothetical protein G4B88_023555 [Cannabis sativa]